jgi:hypothetical protein
MECGHSFVFAVCSADDWVLLMEAIQHLRAAPVAHNWAVRFVEASEQVLLQPGVSGLLLGRALRTLPEISSPILAALLAAADTSSDVGAKVCKLTSLLCFNYSVTRYLQTRMLCLLASVQHDTLVLAAAGRRLTQQLSALLMTDISLQSATRQPVLLAQAADVMLVMGAAASAEWLQVRLSFVSTQQPLIGKYNT